MIVCRFFSLKICDETCEDYTMELKTYFNETNKKLLPYCKYGDFFIYTYRGLKIDKKTLSVEMKIIK